MDTIEQIRLAMAVLDQHRKDTVMALIGPVNLEIQPSVGGQSDVHVDFTITFSSLDQLGKVKYRERISLIGDDILFDDNLIMLRNVVVNPTATTVNRTLDTQVANHILNEDFGRDEIFARVELRDVGQQFPRVRGDSNVVTGWF